MLEEDALSENDDCDLGAFFSQPHGRNRGS